MKHPITALFALTLSFILIPAGPLQAQPDRARHHGPPDAEMRVAHLTRALELSDQQAVRLLEVLQAVDEERQALRQQAMLEMKPQICELQLATEEEIQLILDQEQLAKMEEIMASHKSDSPHRQWRRVHDLDCSEFE